MPRYAGSIKFYGWNGVEGMVDESPVYKVV